MIFLLVVVPLCAVLLEWSFHRPLELRIWNWVLMLYIVGISHALGSRCIGCSAYDDYANVYLSQGQLLRDHGLLTFFNMNANQTGEYLFYLIFRFLVLIFPQQYWLAGFAFLSMYFLRLALRSYLHPREIMLLLAFSSVGLSTQLIRQYLAWSFLAMVIFRGTGKAKILSLIGAFFVHHSVLILYGKYILAKILKWRILIFVVFLLLFFEYALEWLLTLNYYSVEFLTSEVGMDVNVLSYNNIFLPRVIILMAIFIVLLFRNLYSVFAWYILLSVGIFAMTFLLPLVPVRANLLLLSHAFGLGIIFCMRQLKLSRLSFLYFGGLLLFYVRIYFVSSGDFKLWYQYNVWL